jgi:hypothetical protein
VDLGRVLGDPVQGSSLRRPDLDREGGFDLRQEPLDREPLAVGHLPVAAAHDVS